jgi:hypothetical protein
MTRDDLEHIWAWANDKLATGEKPSWMWDQYMKLCETLDSILAEMTHAIERECAETRSGRGAHLRLVADRGRVLGPRRPDCRT